VAAIDKRTGERPCERRGHCEGRDQIRAGGGLAEDGDCGQEHRGAGGLGGGASHESGGKVRSEVGATGKKSVTMLGAASCPLIHGATVSVPLLR